MDVYTATEVAYKNGYERGKKDAIKHSHWDNGRCANCGFNLRCLTDGENNLEQWVWDDGLDYCPSCGAKMKLCGKILDTES